jgi:hypothetical protein
MEPFVLFDKVTEFRQRGICTYSLSEVLTIALFAEISGADDVPEIVAYGKEKIDFLKSILPKLKRIPSEDTINHVFQNIDTTVFKPVIISEPVRKYLKGISLDNRHLKNR